ncbi:hypothetical protein AB1Y20_012842 [Prymnesium parvum]|uniref:Ubiquitin-like domain-containing protein n=1 Tax=Prymnesium parvum TaxID=97485 RepID=A0AB34IMJ0_PRYPA
MHCAKCGVDKLSVEFPSLPHMVGATALRRTCLGCIIASMDSTLLPTGVDVDLLRRQHARTSGTGEFDTLARADVTASANMKYIMVRNASGGTVNVNIPQSNLIRDLRHEVARALQVPHRGLRLLYSGIELKGRKGGRMSTLEEYGVTLGAQLHAIMAFSQYAGQNHIAGAALDQYGNAVGSEYDLSVDGAFNGMAIVVLQLYFFDFSLPSEALQQKGFRVEVHRSVPSPYDLETALKQDDVTQFWLISAERAMISNDHVTVIRDFWEAGHGLYIWGDNDPYYYDANVVSKSLIGVEQRGNVTGDQVVTVAATGPGVRPHEISTGMTTVYEGITIATIDESPRIKPLIVGSANNVVCAYSDEDGKRMLIDGGFTRLFCKWDSAGTARYIVNAAGWLVNFDQFD